MISRMSSGASGGPAVAPLLGRDVPQPPAPSCRRASATGSRPRPSRGTHITAVGPSASTPVPSDARVIDGSGRYLIPGLWDMHVHLTVAGRMSVSLFPVNGVTGVRDMGGDLATVDGFRADIARGALLGPRIYRAGPFLD